ncbi:SPOR domain-containing protein [Sphingomonas sp. IC-11]|uniref:SPOR domain-containing protein n=1 Tax=Sphingomonas sp. IC-11 TaxID=2898528 RepID=UPI001E47600A|nr:SPOR domain-containing protein [Sphingomonas sp. IC-11]
MAEVTSLDTGSTILVLIDGHMAPRGDSAEIELSPAAAGLLGLADRLSAPVRVRGVAASAADLAELRAGRPAGRRLDAPPGLLAALRKQLELGSAAAITASQTRSPAVSAMPTAVRTSAVPSRVTPAVPRMATSGRYLVQVAALSSQSRARALAETLGGYVEGTGGLHRVRLGPFADKNSAQRARDAAERRGYGGAAIIVQP